MKFRRKCASLAKHRGSDDATTLTTADVRGWMEALQAEGRLSNRTIGNAMTDIGAVRRWGVHQDEGAFAEAPLSNMIAFRPRSRRSAPMIASAV